MPLVVDFCTKWCGPCKFQDKVLDNVAPQYEGRIKFVKVGATLSSQRMETVSMEYFECFPELGCLLCRLRWREGYAGFVLAREWVQGSSASQQSSPAAQLGPWGPGGLQALSTQE